MTGQQRHLSEADIFQLLEEANQQYDEYVRLTEIPDFPEQTDPPQPLYSWANPVGLVIAGPDPNPLLPTHTKDARLV